MRLQSNSYSCGIYAVVNALRALGKKVPIKTVRAHTGTTKDGTTAHGIKNALERLGYSGSHEFLLPKAEAFESLLKMVGAGHPVILSCEFDNHWVVAIGAIGDRVVIYDSQLAAWNKSENGVGVLSKRQMMTWWKPETGKFFYAIVVME